MRADQGERERGFNVYIAGANEERVKEEKLRRVDSAARTRGRRKWSESPVAQRGGVLIRGEDGARYGAAIPSVIPTAAPSPHTHGASPAPPPSPAPSHSPGTPAPAPRAPTLAGSPFSPGVAPLSPPIVAGQGNPAAAGRSPGVANGATAATRGSGLGDLPGRYEDLMSRLRGMARGGAEGGVEAGQGGGSGVLGGGDADLGEYAGSEFDSYSGDEDKGAREHGDAAEASSGDERGGVYSDDFTGPGSDGNASASTDTPPGSPPPRMVAEDARFAPLVPAALRYTGARTSASLSVTATATAANTDWGPTPRGEAGPAVRARAWSARPGAAGVAATGPVGEEVVAAVVRAVREENERSMASASAFGVREGKERSTETVSGVGEGDDRATVTAAARERAMDAAWESGDEGGGAGGLQGLAGTGRVPPTANSRAAVAEVVAWLEGRLGSLPNPERGILEEALSRIKAMGAWQEGDAEEGSPSAQPMALRAKAGAASAPLRRSNAAPTPRGEGALLVDVNAAGSIDGPVPLPTSPVDVADPASPFANNAHDTPPSGSSPRAAAPSPAPGTAPPADACPEAQTVVLQLLGSWGGGAEVGLAGMALLDAGGSEVAVAPGDVAVRGGVAGRMGGARLVGGGGGGWEGRVARDAATAAPLEIVLRVPGGRPRARRLRVRNHAGGKTRAVRGAVVLVGGRVVWRGDLRWGPGEDGATDIDLGGASRVDIAGRPPRGSSPVAALSDVATHAPNTVFTRPREAQSAHADAAGPALWLGGHAPSAPSPSAPSAPPGPAQSRRASAVSPAPPADGTATPRRVCMGRRASEADVRPGFDKQGQAHAPSPPLALAAPSPPPSPPAPAGRPRLSKYPSAHMMGVGDEERPAGRPLPRKTPSAPRIPVYADATSVPPSAVEAARGSRGSAVLEGSAGSKRVSGDGSAVGEGGGEAGVGRRAVAGRRGGGGEGSGREVGKPAVAETSGALPLPPPADAAVSVSVSMSVSPTGEGRRGRWRRGGADGGGGGHGASLEESLDSLALFRKSHAGRLGVGPVRVRGVGWLGHEGAGDGEVDGDGEEGEESPGARMGNAEVAGNVKMEVGSEKGGAGEEVAVGGVRAMMEAALGVGTASVSKSNKDAGAESLLNLMDVAGGAASGGADADGGDAGATEGDTAAVTETTAVASNAAAAESTPSLGFPPWGYRDVWGEEDVVVPEEPRCRGIEMRVHATWGDAFYVGLAGIEVFDAEGHPVAVAGVTADPPSVPADPGAPPDPRTPSKIIDGACVTCDEMHSWVAPFDPARPNRVRLDFESEAALGMARVWNYNASRVHSTRGARLVELAAVGGDQGDEERRLLFRGVVGQAPGNLGQAPACAECIVFTHRPSFFDALDAHDSAHHAEARGAEGEGVMEGEGVGLIGGKLEWERYREGEDAGVELVPDGDGDGDGDNDADSEGRVVLGDAGDDEGAEAVIVSPRGDSSGGVDAEPPFPSSSSHLPLPPSLPLRTLTLEILSTWGDRHYVGLARIALLDAHGQAIPIDPGCITADPPDLNAIPGHSGDPRVAGNLAYKVGVDDDGGGAPTDDARMWLAPLRASLALLGANANAGMGTDKSQPRSPLCTSPGVDPSHNTLTVTLPSEHRVRWLRVWNYNKSAADARRGAQRVRLWADGRRLGPAAGVLLRAAPGDTLVDYAQDVDLAWAAEVAEADAVPEALTAGIGGGMGAVGMGAGGVGAGARRLVTEALVWQLWAGDAGAYCKASAAAAERARKEGVAVPVRQDFEVPLLPCGSLLRIYLLSTWGDPHYVGLTGVEVVDAVAGALDLAGAVAGRGAPPACRVSALPLGVCALPHMSADARTPDKALDAIRSGHPSHSWLTYLPTNGLDPVLAIALPRPAMVAALRFWNYASPPTRGAREVAVTLDGDLIYQGILRPSPDTPGQPPYAQSVLFSNDPGIVGTYGQEACCMLDSPLLAVDTGLYNDGQRVGGPGDAPRCDTLPERPTTGVVR